MNKVEKTTRYYSIDLLKIIIIVYVIIHHILLRGFKVRNLENDLAAPDVAVFLNSFLVVAVNIFFIISGFFKIKYNSIKLLKFISFVYFCYIGVNTILLCIGVVNFDCAFIKGLIFPISQYWYIFVYLVLMLVLPFFTDFFRTLKVEDEKKILIVLYLIFSGYCFLIDNPIFGVNNGYSLAYACVLYMTGDFISKHENTKINKWIYLFLYFFSVGMNGFVAIFLLKHGAYKYAWKMYNYNNPLITIGAVGLFVFFMSFNVKYNKIIELISRYTLSIYILHATPALSHWYTSVILQTGNFTTKVFMSIIIVISMVLMGTMVGIAYDYIWNVLYLKLVRIFRE